jgi:uncharacterized coiled-coil DUF342 family protein
MRDRLSDRERADLAETERDALERARQSWRSDLEEERAQRHSEEEWALKRITGLQERVKVMAAERDRLRDDVQRANALGLVAESQLREAKAEVARLREENEEGWATLKEVTAERDDMHALANKWQCEAEALRDERDRLREALERMTDPPLVLATDDATEVAAWFVDIVGRALEGTSDE